MAMKNSHEEIAEIVRRNPGVAEIIHHTPVLTCMDVVNVVHVPLSSIVKCIVFEGSDARLYVATLPGDKKVSMRKLREATGVHKLTMIKPADIPESLGVPLGAISPFLLPPNATLILDKSLFKGEKLYCGTGDSSSSLVVSGKVLVDFSDGIRADIAE